MKGRSIGREGRSTCHALAASEDHHPAEGTLVGIQGTRLDVMGEILRLHAAQTVAGAVVSGDQDGCHGDAPSVGNAFLQEQAGLDAVEGDGLRSADGLAQHMAGLAMEAGGNVHRNDGQAALVSGGDQLGA